MWRLTKGLKEIIEKLRRDKEEFLMKLTKKEFVKMLMEREVCDCDDDPEEPDY